ncbi:hypothetical protein KIW84_074102 [Lathyrus oleraceus]|uniref:Uncharacterized protein n=1 Tax=Pisum sativum TaxID=3888 RepID=A0A9D4ZZH9_PEA|nr:hypothetical protein KIW84_074102 [Pisum sativum]
MSYAQLLSSLQQLQLVQLSTLTPPVGRLPVGYDANARCSFHSGAPGHNIKNYKAFKHVVQDLIDSKAINLAPAPNVVNNPMPQHGSANVNMVEGEARPIKDVLKLKTPLLDIKDCLLKADVFLDCGKGCLDCATQSKVEDFSVQESTEGVEEEVFEDATDEFADVDPIDCVIPIDVFNFSNVVADIPNNVVDSDVIELDSDVSDVYVSMNEISEYDYDVATITIFYPTAQINVPEAQPVPPVRPSTMTITTPERPLKVEEGQKSELEVEGPAVDNVGGIRRFTRSGRLFSPPVTQTDNVDVAAKAKGKQVVNEGASTPQAGSEPTFTKDVDELLRIIKKSDYKAVNQLIQTPSKISILSLLLCSEAHREALLKVLNVAYVPQEISVNQLEGIVANVHASNGLGFTDSDLTPAGRNHNKALHISLECKDIVLSHVLVDTGSSLNVLPKRALSRIITVCGEEDILVNNLSTFKYVEVEGEFHETLCQAFEAVQIKDAAPVEEVKAGASISSFKQAQALVDSGVASGWGHLLELPMKEDKFGIGYQPALTSTTSTLQTRQGPITFSSAGIIQYGQVSTVNDEDVDSDCDIDNWVGPRIPGEVINNWSSEEIVQVTFLEE